MSVPHWVETPLFRALLAAVRTFPALGVWVPRLAARLGPRLGFDRRARAGLALALPDLGPEAHLRIRKAMYRNFVPTAYEHLCLVEMVRDSDSIEIVGAEHLTAAAARGPVLLLSAHFGHWEAVRIAAARLGVTAGFFRRAFNNAAVDAQARAMLGYIDAPLFHKGPRGLAALSKHLRQGGSAMMLLDVHTLGAPELTFLGAPAATATIGADLAIRNGAAMLPARAERIGEGSRFRVTFEAPILRPEGPDAAAALAMTQALNDRYSDWIRAAPEQWFWLHRRWGKARARDGA